MICGQNIDTQRVAAGCKDHRVRGLHSLIANHDLSIITGLADSPDERPRVGACRTAGYGYVKNYCLTSRLRAKSYEQVSEWMSLKRETPEPIEQRDAGNVGPPRSSSTILRKRILAVFVIVLTALMLTAYVYYRSAYQRSAGDWRWFWAGEVIVGVLVVVGIVQALRNGR